ncbi:hypothetical protein ACFQ1E_17350 [Sphingomonas canadensis]|uniref:DUF2190 domain-containing protein n=1 Tax=Sphingomonas canadensis TaxID=1219257 RepID=A0ABW3H9L8_9SPHN|nr:hypothetical protein [Sphingomonas canadensis]MCW3837814.1 hypothetical protein [Sphingomonas canadensis]
MSDISITATSVVAGAGARVEHGTAGTTITAGQWVYKDAATGRYLLADSNSATAAARVPRGIALNGGANGQPVAIALSGPVTIGGTLTAGVGYYLSDTPGGTCPVADVGSGEYATFLGMATSTTVLNIDIQASGVAL